MGTSKHKENEDMRSDYLVHRHAANWLKKLTLKFASKFANVDKYILEETIKHREM